MHEHRPVCLTRLRSWCDVGCPRRQARVSLTINISYNSIRVPAADLHLGEQPSANLTVAFWRDSAQHKTIKIGLTMTIRYWRTGPRISYVNRLPRMRSLNNALVAKVARLIRVACQRS